MIAHEAHRQRLIEGVSVGGGSLASAYSLWGLLAGIESVKVMDRDSQCMGYWLLLKVYGAVG